MALYGWDCSDYDHARGPMDLAAAARAGISFFTHKYTEGTTVRHHPAGPMTAARAAGIPFLGGYMVPRSTPSIAAQVSYLLAYAEVQTPWWHEHPGWFWQVDTEHWSYDTVSGSIGAAACAELRRRTGRAVLHYAPQWAYGDGIPGREPLWASHYVSGSGDFKALAAKVTTSHWGAYSGRTPAILQYSSSAVIAGQPSCDVNLFRGTAADFARLIGVATASSAPLPEGDPMYIGLATGERYAVGPAGPVLIDWDEWKASFGEAKSGWPQVLILGSDERVEQFRPAAAAVLTAAQLAELVAELKAALGDAEPGLTGAEIEAHVLSAMTRIHLSTSFTATA